MYGFTRYLMVIIGFASFGFAIVSVNFSRNYKSIEKKKKKSGRPSIDVLSRGA